MGVKGGIKKKHSNMKLPIETDVDKLSVADEKRVYTQSIYKLSQPCYFKETIEEIPDLEEQIDPKANIHSQDDS
jgi:hypothetical protein